MMPLWEILIAGFLLPAFYYFWKWTSRILAGVASVKIGTKLAEQIKESVLNKIKGEDDACSNASTDAATKANTGAQ